MRHLLFILILLLALFPVHTCGQEALPVGMPETAASDVLAASYGLAARKEKPAYKQTVYWKRYKALKITGWSSLAVGIPAISCFLSALPPLKARQDSNQLPPAPSG